MTRRTEVGALAAWAAALPGPEDGGRGSAVSAVKPTPFRSASFDDVHGAVAAALLLMSAVPHRDGAAPIGIAIALGDPEGARADADALASRAPPGSILLTPAAVEAIGHRLPDGMALRAESVTTDHGVRTAFALRSATEVMPHSLPVPATRLIGRASELRELRDLLAVQRLVTLAGPPGSGKTRLAVELGRSALGAFSDGAWFVPLAPIQDEGLVAHAVARALDLSEKPGTPMSEVVAQHLASRRLLLIFDNFEHLLSGAAVVAQWLAGALDLHVLVTSREPLHLSGEWEFEVPPLRVPSDANDPRAAEVEAVQLFTERARAVDASFETDGQTLRDVVQICRRLDGLPLAVELAAARAKALPVASILGRLERSMELLTRGARDIPERHHSLRAAVSWSHDLLTPGEQAFFRRLAAFRGGWSLDSADAVTAARELGQDALDLTTSLLDKSLIRRHSDPGSEPRYDVLEVIREYAHERLRATEEDDQTMERHAIWFLDLAERAAPMLTGVERGLWLDQLERELDNLRTALRWALDHHRIELGMRLAAALWRFWQIRAHMSEGRQVLAELLEVDAEVDPVIRARALSAAGSLAYWQNDGEASMALYEASLELRRQLGDPVEVASALYDLGHALSCVAAVKDPARGRHLELEALEIYRSLGSRMGEAWLVWALGCNAHFTGDNRQAVNELGHAIELFRELGDPFGLAWALTMRGLAAMLVGQRQVAAQHLREALPIFAEVDDVSGIDSVLEHLARLAAAEGDPRRAVRLAAAAARIRGISESAIIKMVYAGQPAGSRPLMLDRAKLPLTPEEVEALTREGEEMTTAEAVAYALADQPAQAVAGLRVRALGPMQVERDGRRILRWGGDKAGSRQAQAIFAFLFDRGLAGITKDEAVELLWPDLPIKRGDLAFHRTLGGLRAVLEEGRQQGNVISYEGGRYRLAPELVDWSEVAAFEQVLDGAAGLEGPERTAAQEEARDLYRGDLFDDCPFYGDSVFVEERRAYLRGRHEDLLVELGDQYAALGDESLALARFRQALKLNPESTRARSGIDRLGPVAEADAV
jgi:predicted ATPase/DNA-binding SARP family transcriptional activator